MAKTTQWTGNAQDTPQQTEVTLTGAAASGTTYSITLLGKQVSYVGQSGDTKDAVLQALQSAISNSLDPEWRQLRTAEADETLTCTGQDDGRSFTLTVSASLSKTVSVNGSSKHDWDESDNWDNGVPAAGDTVIFSDSSIDVRYGLDQTGISLANLVIRADYTGQIGLLRYDKYGAYEQSDRYLIVGGLAAAIGAGSGTGSQCIRWDQDGVNCIMTVHATGTSNDPDLAALRIDNTGSLICTVHAGTCDIGWQPQQSVGGAVLLTATGGATRIGSKHAGSNITITCTGGSVECTEDVQSATLRGSGQLIQRSGTIASAACYDNAALGVRDAVAITAMTLDGGVLDASGAAICSLAAITLANSGSIRDPQRAISYTTITVSNGRNIQFS